MMLFTVFFWHKRPNFFQSQTYQKSLGPEIWYMLRQKQYTVLQLSITNSSVKTLSTNMVEKKSNVC